MSHRLAQMIGNLLRRNTGDSFFSKMTVNRSDDEWSVSIIFQRDRQLCQFQY